MKRVLLTRTLEDNKKIKEILERKNYEICEEPLLTKQINNDTESILNSFPKNQKIIVTSNFVPTILKKHLLDKSHEFYLVGEESANELKGSGFEVKLFSENVDSLIREIDSYPADFIYLRGNIISKKIPNVLREEVIYNTIYIDHFSKNLVEKFQLNQIDIVTVFSLKALEVFIECSDRSKINTKNLSLYSFFRENLEAYDDKFSEIKKATNNNINNFLDLF